MKTFRKIYACLFNSEKAIQFRILNACVLTGTFCATVAIIVSLIFGFQKESIIFTALSILCSLFTLLIANVWEKPVFASAFIVLVINLFLFPCMYLFSGGINSGAPIWLLMGVILSFPITSGTKRTIIIYLISLLGPIGAVIAGFIHPEWIIPLASEKLIVIDIITAVVLVSIMFGAMFKIQTNAYEKQKKQIEESAKIAIEATKAKSSFISNMTHDIRTPMNSIIGFTEIARKNADKRTTLLESLSNISLASEHLLALVNDVLEMSRIESGKFELQNEPASMTAIIEKVEKIMTPEIEDLNLHFIVDTTDILEDSISCDVLRLTQILINILGNAVKYSHPDGHIFLSVTQKQSSSNDNILCEIRVRDEGIGISPAFIPHVFESFSRENKTSVNGTSGSGLGLPIAKEMIELMGGTISVNSEEGKGSEFIINIPFEIPTLGEFDNSSDSKEYRFDGKRVLVVEDNELNCEIVCELLTESGFEVESVRDGTYAIEKLKGLTDKFYDVILMDIQMPLMSGYEATEIIRSFPDDRIGLVPVVALTANAFDGDREKAEQSGMNGFIAKPINAHEMFSTLHRILQ